ncbi:hypothetical protein [Kitasatospora sp. NPDC092286]|uniref:hypothetical protein n=1 Tax=Kitasatospora sp. NPDC092286 TaxID=3364087 RepID=UPI0038175158
MLQPGPRDLAVAIRWQPTEEHPLPGGVLGVNVCSRTGHPVGACQICNMILESRLADAGLRTAYADGHLVVVHPDVEIPGQPRRESTAPPAAPARPARRRGWPARWLRSRTGR